MTMKHNLFLGIIAAVLSVAAVVFIGCEGKNGGNSIVRYAGKVVYAGTSTPFPNLEVKVTDGEHIHCLEHTNAEGQFVLTVRVDDINGDYYVLAGDSTCLPKRVDIPGYGQEQFDLGTIEVEGPSLPVVSTSAVSNITDETATCGGNVTSDGRSSVTARGVCWSKTEYPIVNDSHTTNGTGTGEFQSQIINLEAGTTYYVRAYATNRIGTAYGEQRTLSSLTGLPQVTTDDISDISATTATCGGSVAANSGYAITARGICWSSTTASPTMQDSHTEEVATTGHFTSLMLGLERNTTYYVRAYAVNEKGANYGETKTFTTLTGLPIVNTMAASNIMATTALGGGDVTNNGGYNIMSRGVCWSSTSSTPTTEDNHTNEVADNGPFNSLITGLSPNTTYYVRAYATNEAGTGYGNVITFSTPTGLPVVITKEVTNIKTTTAVANGNVTSDGGYAITARGVCWSATSSTPSLEDQHTSEVGGNGAFTSLMTELLPNTTYYVRIYATNELGTSYGDVVHFTTSNGLPSVQTIDPNENITTTSITASGNVKDDGGFPITERGFAYNTLPYPTIENGKKITSGSGTGYFSATISNISPTSQTYYIRAYAINEKGTAYGDQVIITPERSEYLSLKTMVYGGYTYKIRPIGAMAWQAGYNACQSMVYGGYDDWFMPNADEVQAIITYVYQKWGEKYYLYGCTSTKTPNVKQLLIEGSTEIWTSTSSSTSYYIYDYDFRNNELEYRYWKKYNSTSSSSVCLVFAVRKYRKDN